MQDKEQDNLLKTVEAYQKTFKSELGQEVFRDLLDRSGLEFAAVDLDHAQLSYNEGRRAFFLEIKSMVDADISKMKEVVNSDQ